MASHGPVQPAGTDATASESNLPTPAPVNAQAPHPDAIINYQPPVDNPSAVALLKELLSSSGAAEYELTSEPSPRNDVVCFRLNRDVRAVLQMFAPSLVPSV